MSASSALLGNAHAPAQPFLQMLEIEPRRGVGVEHKSLGFAQRRIPMRAIDDKKRVSDSERGSLVAIKKRMILREAFSDCGGLFNQVSVVPVLRTK